MQRIFVVQFIIISTLLSFIFFACSKKEETPLTSITLSVDKTTANLDAGESFVFTVIGNDEANYTSTAEFYVNNSKISGNTYTPTAKGEYAIQAKLGNLQSNTITVNVTSTAIELTSITLSVDKTTANLNAGESFVFTVTGNDEVNYTSTAELYVNNSKISGNTYTPTAQGEYEVYAKLDELLSNTITVEVIGSTTITLTSITLSVDKPSIYANSGEFFVFTVIGDNEVNYTSAAEFYVNNTSIAGNTYTAAAGGTYSVYAEYDGLQSNTIIVEVMVIELTSLTITVNKPLIYENSGDFFVFTVMGNDYLNYTSAAEFHVNNTSIAGNTYTATAGTYSVYAEYDGLQSNTIIIEVKEPLAVSVNKSTIYNDATESFVFTVTNNVNGTNVTSASELYVNNNKITGSIFSTSANGTYTVYAKHNNITSRSINIEVVENPTPSPNSSIYTNKVLVEDFTGTWCQYCTRILWAIELVHRQTDKVVVAAIHRGSNDPWNLSAGATLEGAFPSLVGSSFQGYPTALLNRSAEWNFPEHTTYLNQPINMIKTNCKYGMAIASNLGASSGSVTVYFSFKENLSNARAVVYILEDNLIYNQANYYTNLYGGASTLVNFNHKDVVRRVASSSILGQDIPADQSVTGNVYAMSFSATYTSSNINNLKVMVVLLNSNGRVENVQVAPANSSQDYELAE